MEIENGHTGRIGNVTHYKTGERTELTLTVFNQKNSFYNPR